MEKTKKAKIKFEKLKINESVYGKTIKSVFVVKKDGKSVLDDFKTLSEDQRDEIIALISTMATTTPKLKSNKVRWSLASRTYGEIKPDGHRFFFFTVIDRNIIFFDYAEKKQDNLRSEVYDNIETKKENYDEKFRKQHPEHCKSLLS